MTIDDLVALLKTLDKWLIVFGVLVAIGVVGEAVVGFIHFRKSSELQRLQTDENLKQQKEIEQLRADNLKLEALIQPRSLTTEKQRMIGESLRVLSGQKVTVLSFATDSGGIPVRRTNSCLEDGGHGCSGYERKELRRTIRFGWRKHKFLDGGRQRRDNRNSPQIHRATEVRYGDACWHTTARYCTISDSRCVG